MQKIVLASSSPRRSELLKQIGLKFDVIPSNVEETLENGLEPAKAAEKLSSIKAISIARHLKQDDNYSNAIVIGSDTIVSSSQLLGKPSDTCEAAEMLSELSGKKHQVITGITLVRVRDMHILKQHEVTDVYFRKLSSKEIEWYISTGEPMDKAGAYGIQGYGALLVDRIDGCYYNVVGLPLARLYKMLKDIGYDFLEQ